MELLFSKTNHMKMGYDGAWFNLRTHPKESWNFLYGRITRDVLDFKTECLLAAQDIRNTFSGPLFIGFSGGVDSEVVAESFRQAGIDFTALILRFPSGKNEHDIVFAKQYCDRWNIPILYYDIDPLEYYQTQEFSSRSQSAHCLFPMLAIQAKGLERAAQLGGICVMGGGDFLFSGETNQDVIITHKEVSGSVIRIQIVNGIPGVYRFFRWSPELIGSFFLDPKIQKLIIPREAQRDFSAQEKLNFYQCHFDLAARPKYYGWEEFSQLEQKIRLQLIKRFSFADSKVEMSYAEFAKRLGFDKIAESRQDHR